MFDVIRGNNTNISVSTSFNRKLYSYAFIQPKLLLSILHQRYKLLFFNYPTTARSQTSSDFEKNGCLGRLDRGLGRQPHTETETHWFWKKSTASVEQRELCHLFLKNLSQTDDQLDVTNAKGSFMEVEEEHPMHKLGDYYHRLQIPLARQLGSECWRPSEGSGQRKFDHTSPQKPQPLATCSHPVSIPSILTRSAYRQLKDLSSLRCFVHFKGQSKDWVYRELHTLQLFLVFGGFSRCRISPNTCYSYKQPFFFNIGQETITLVIHQFFPVKVYYYKNDYATETVRDFYWFYT